MKTKLFTLALAFASLGNINAQEGLLDLTFNANGAGISQTPGSVDVQADGKILLGSTTVGNYTYNGITAKRILRLNADGSNDNSFAGYSTSTNLLITAIKYLPNTKILFADGVTNGSRVIRMQADGTIDAFFNDPKKSFWNAGIRVNSIVPQYNDKILVGGTFLAYQNITGKDKYPYLARLDEDGSVDNTFNAGGIGPNNLINIIAPTANNKFYIGGKFTKYNGIDILGIARVNQDGSIDNSFNFGGGGTDGEVKSISEQTDGKIVLAGTFTKFNGIPVKNIIRLNANGTLDLTFNSPIIESATGGILAINKVIALADGKILFAGRFNKFDTILTGSIGRLNSDGTLDNTFNPSGKGAKTLAGTVLNNSNLTQLNLQPDGKILIAGDFNNYNTDGTKKLFHRLTGSTLPASLGVSLNSKLSNKIQIAPNPSTGIFRIKNFENINSVEIYDATGKLIKQLKGNGKDLEVNLTSVQKGIYFIKTNSSTGKSDNGQKLILK